MLQFAEEEIDTIETTWKIKTWLFSRCLLSLFTIMKNILSELFLLTIMNFLELLVIFIIQNFVCITLLITN